MKYFALFLAIIPIISCTSSVKKVAESHDTAINDTGVEQQATAITSLCFLRTEGNSHQDSTTVELDIRGNKISGEMNWLPGLKDGRRGILMGTKDGDIIKAMWTYKQEGITDSISVEFKLLGNQLVQKPLKTDPKTGRQLTDKAAAYSLIFYPSNSLRPAANE